MWRHRKKCPIFLCQTVSTVAYVVIQIPAECEPGGYRNDSHLSYLFFLHLKIDHPHDDNVNLIATAGVVVEIRHHVHNGQQILFVVGAVVKIEKSFVSDQPDLDETMNAVSAGGRFAAFALQGSHRFATVHQLLVSLFHKSLLPLGQLLGPRRLPVVC